MLNPRQAPTAIVNAVERRVKRIPGAEFDRDAVKLISLPGVPLDAVLFVFRQGNKFALACELQRGGVHIYKAFAVDPSDAKQSAAVTLAAVTAVANAVKRDPRFRRNVISAASSIRLLRPNGKGGAG